MEQGSGAHKKTVDNRLRKKSIKNIGTGSLLMF